MGKEYRDIWRSVVVCAMAMLGGESLAGEFPYPIVSRTLDNGLTVHVVPMDSPGVAAWATWMSVGSRDELDAGRTGFAHFFEHLMFLGTETVPAADRERALLRMAADDNAWTWFDDTVYHSVVPAASLRKLISIEGDRFMNLTLTPEDVAREAGAVFGEYRKAKVRPGRQLRAALYATAFTQHTYGHTTLGYEADIIDMPSAHAYAQQFFQRHYRPDRATIFAVGDVEPDEVFTWVEAGYGAWAPAVLVEPLPELLVEPGQEVQRAVEVAWPSTTAPRLAMGWRAPTQADDDGVALDLVEALLLSEVGPLHRRLVLEEELAFAVYGGRDDFVDPALFTIYVQLRPGADVAAESAALARVELIIREEVASLAAGADTEAVERVRQHTRAKFLSSLDDPGVVLEQLGWAVRRAGPDALDTYVTRFGSLTAADLSKAVSTWLLDEGLTMAVLRHSPTEVAP